MARPHTTLMLHSLARVKPQKSGKKSEESEVKIGVIFGL